MTHAAAPDSWNALLWPGLAALAVFVAGLLAPFVWGRHLRAKLDDEADAHRRGRYRSNYLSADGRADLERKATFGTHTVIRAAMAAAFVLWSLQSGPKWEYAQLGLAVLASFGAIVSAVQGWRTSRPDPRSIAVSPRRDDPAERERRSAFWRQAGSAIGLTLIAVVMAALSVPDLLEALR